MRKNCEIKTKRFLLRILTEDDATESYYAWLNDIDTKKFIVPLAVGARISEWGVPQGKIVELDWWEQAMELTGSVMDKNVFERDALSNSYSVY